MSKLKSILIFYRCRPSYLTIFRYFCTSPFLPNRNLRLNNRLLKITFHTIFEISAASCEQRSHTNWRQGHLQTTEKLDSPTRVLRSFNSESWPASILILSNPLSLSNLHIINSNIFENNCLEIINPSKRYRTLSMSTKRCVSTISFNASLPTRNTKV